VAKIIARDEIFQIPLGIALTLLLAEMLILKRIRRAETPPSPARGSSDIAAFLRQKTSAIRVG
jgi:hypothetical protein